MKKSILAIGLFTLVLVSTSFAAPTSSIADNAIITPFEHEGGQDSGGNQKVDYTGDTTINTSTIQNFEHEGGQDSGGNQKVD